MATWIWIILGILYILSPYDLLPDFIPIRGWIDDAVVILLLYRYIARLRARKRYTETQRTSGGSQARQASPESGPERPKSPYEILGVSPGATKEQIHKAYLHLVNQYHPDKVAHLGKEFQDLAEEKFKEIQEAYRSLNYG